MRRFIGIGVISLSLAFASTAMAGGEDIFKAKCLPCHGAEGAGTAMAPAFQGNAFVKDSPATDVAATIREGRAGAQKHYKQFALAMPPQKGALSEAEITEVVEYIKSLAK